MENRIVPGYVALCCGVLRRAGYEAYPVGGCVRDLLMGVSPHDWDVCTSAPPERTAALFPHTVLTGMRHGTVTVVTEDGTVEITTFRRDGAYSDGRHPDRVTFGASLEEDLSRRDFTVNAMALAPDGAVIDPFGGREDLAGRVIRAVGEAEQRFREDALRILRGLRFSARLGFAIEPGTASALRRCGPLLGHIALERVREELTGLLCGEHAAEILLEYPDVLGVVLPEILPCVGFDQRSRYHCYDVWEHIARSVAAVKPLPVLRWTMLLHDVGKPEVFTLDEKGQGHFYNHWRTSRDKAEAILDRLRFDNHSKKTILTLVERHDAPLSMDEKSVRRNLARYGEETLRLLLEVKRGDSRAHAAPYRGRVELLDRWEIMLDEVLARDSCFSLKQLAVKGNDLTDIGLRGPAVGRCLSALLERVIDGTLPNDRAALLDYVKEELL